MLTDKDRHHAKKRKKVWDHFGWVYLGVNYLSKNHSLNCGCKMCQMKTYFKRLEHRQNRIKNKRELKEILKNLK